MDNRDYVGKNKDGIIFSATPNLSKMSDAYLRFVEEMKHKIYEEVRGQLA